MVYFLQLSHLKVRTSIFLAGVSAPFVAIFLIGKHKKQKIGAILWNLAGLMLVVNILFHGVRTTPYFGMCLYQISLTKPYYISLLFSYQQSLFQLLFLVIWRPYTNLFSKKNCFTNYNENSNRFELFSVTQIQCNFPCLTSQYELIIR